MAKRFQQMVRSLDRRFRPYAMDEMRGERISHVMCPVDINYDDIAHCLIQIGDRYVPILAQWNVADKHIDSAFGLSFFKRPELERNVATLIEGAYGDFPQVRCDAPAQGWSVPGTEVNCALKTPSRAGARVKVDFLNTGGWLVARADAVPADERPLADAFARNGGRNIPGKIVARIIKKRDAVMMRRLGEPFGIDHIACPKKMNLANQHESLCDVSIDGSYARERVVYTRGRLAFRVAGAFIDLDRVRTSEKAALQKRFHTPASADVSIDCAADHVIVVDVNAYHWCEISGPPKYPKRLVITSLDRDGHYDVFFSNSSQSAWEQQKT